MITNSDQLKHISTVRGAQTVKSINIVPASDGNLRRVLSQANGHKGAECHPAYIVSSILHPLSQFGNVVAMSGEIVSSRFIVSHTCSVGERFGDLAGQCS